MRLATWNVNGGGEAKIASCVAELRPDILVAPECRDPAPLQLSATEPATSTVFIGVTGQKGLSVLAYGDYEVRLVEDIYDPDLVRIAPIVVEGPVSCKLLAVWPDNSTRRRPALEALAVYRDWLAQGDVLVAGDFNDGPQWDTPGDRLGWSALVERLDGLGLQRASMCTSPTLYMNRHADKPYVVDHVFVPWAWQVLGSQVGAHADWAAQSDHMPLTIDLEVPVVRSDSAQSRQLPEAS